MTNTPRWLLPVLTGTLAALGTAALAAAALLPGPAPAPSATSMGPTPRPVPTVGGQPHSTSVEIDGTPINELADPEWVDDVAATAGIPARALAAYAGAAIHLSHTDPDCGIGWNTLAAVGFVESEHGTMHDSRIREDGTARPDIIGLPLNGDGVAAVPDTDDGDLDGDATWDRAVGPMQFIPSSWKLLAQDGDLDGKTDVHDIDDAALAAAIHLCDVGGDLTEPGNWIAAIGAYNNSVEYNHRVAEAASRYATLG